MERRATHKKRDENDWRITVARRIGEVDYNHETMGKNKQRRMTGPGEYQWSGQANTEGVCARRGIYRGKGVGEVEIIVKNQSVVV